MNPFIYYEPVRGTDFYNREEEIEKILKATVLGSARGNIWITGERQVGKSSLLINFQLKYSDYSQEIKLYKGEQNYKVAFVYTNVQDCFSVEDFYLNLRQSLKNHFDYKIRNVRGAYESFIHVLKHLHFEKHFFIVFLIDEFDALIENLAHKNPLNAAEFISKLNLLLEGLSSDLKGSKAFTCVFAANHTIDELMRENAIPRHGSGLVIKETIELPWFSKKHLEGISKRYLSHSRVAFTTQDIDFVYKLAKGYPYFSQKIFSLLYDYKRQTDEARMNYKLVKEEFGKDFEATIRTWGAENMPRRTYSKLRVLAEKMSLGQHITKLVFNTLENYAKNPSAIIPK